MTSQQQAAMAAMIDWLAHENELGREPSRIEIAGEFDLHGMHYYMFKYKKDLLGQWLLGVCGGYENPSDTEHCGHVFSEMQPYDPATAEQDAIAMIEMIRAYWMNLAEELKAAEGQDYTDGFDENEENEHSAWMFNGFVLLNTHECDWESVKTNLMQDWNIACSWSENEKETPVEETEDSLVFQVEGCTFAVSYIDVPVPNGEAEYFAQGNYLWREAVEVTKTHVAHLIVAVVSSSGSPLDRGELYVKLAASCLKLPNAIGIYTSGTVLQPEFFIEVAEMMKSENIFPLLNLVYFGLVGSESGVSGYTFRSEFVRQK